MTWSPCITCNETVALWLCCYCGCRCRCRCFSAVFVVVPIFPLPMYASVLLCTVCTSKHHIIVSMVFDRYAQSYSSGLSFSNLIFFFHHIYTCWKQQIASPEIRYAVQKFSRLLNDRAIDFVCILAHKNVLVHILITADHIQMHKTPKSRKELAPFLRFQWNCCHLPVFTLCVVNEMAQNMFTKVNQLFGLWTMEFRAHTKTQHLIKIRANRYLIYRIGA